MRIGKNMYVIQFENDIVVIDCASKFPDESLLGIDLIIPDVTYLQENKEKNSRISRDAWT